MEWINKVLPYSTENYTQYPMINHNRKNIFKNNIKSPIDSKESTNNAGDQGLIPGSGRSPGEWNGYPLQYSDLENSMDCYSPWGHKEWDTTKQFSLSLLLTILYQLHLLNSALIVHNYPRSLFQQTNKSMFLQNFIYKTGTWPDFLCGPQFVDHWSKAIISQSMIQES